MISAQTLIAHITARPADPAAPRTRTVKLIPAMVRYDR
jgi:hypothetical protein